MSRERLDAEALELVAVRFRLLGEPMRLRILQELQDGEKSVGTLTAMLQSTQTNMSKHLKILQEGGMLTRRTQGTSVYYAISDASVFTLCEVVCAGMREHFSSRARMLTAATA